LNWKSSRYAAYYLDPKEINEAIKLNLSKELDSILRAYFYFVPLKDNENLEIKKPEIKEFKRNGFTVVEWGGIGK
jgi:internalin A